MDCCGRLLNCAADSGADAADAVRRSGCGEALPFPLMRRLGEGNLPHDAAASAHLAWYQPRCARAARTHAATLLVFWFSSEGGYALDSLRSSTANLQGKETKSVPISQIRDH